MGEVQKYAVAETVRGEVSTRLGNENVPAPQGEPVLGQIDNNIINIIESYCIRLNEAGQKVIVYPELLNFTIPLGHLRRTTNLDEEDAMIAWIDFRMNVRKIRSRYRNDSDVLDLLDKIENEAWVVLMGDAKGGRRQRYLSTTYRNINIAAPTQQEKKPWWRPF